jgi:hypothetical protein
MAPRALTEDRPCAVSCGLILGLTATAAAQSIAVDRQRGLQMLDQVREDPVQITDPRFGGST